MPDTTARGIQFPVVGDQLTPLADHFEALAETTDDAITAALSSLGLQWRTLTNGGQSHTSSGSWQTLQNWSGVDGDPGNAVGITYASGVLTVSSDGLYAGLLTTTFNDDPDGTRSNRFLKTGAVALGAAGGWLGRTSAIESGTAWFLASLVNGDTVTIQAFQSSGGTLALNVSASNMNKVTIVRLGIAL